MQGNNFFCLSFIQEKIYPGSGHSPLKGSEVTTLVQKVVKELMKKLGQKDIRVVKETAASTHTPRQQAPLTSQIKGGKPVLIFYKLVYYVKILPEVWEMSRERVDLNSEWPCAFISMA